jgi:hypothetical protein
MYVWPDPLTLGELNVAVTPVGNPEIANETVPVNPRRAITLRGTVWAVPEVLFE